VRQCASCGQLLDDGAFYRDARRCRSCVSSESWITGWDKRTEFIREKAKLRRELRETFQREVANQFCLQIAPTPKQYEELRGRSWGRALSLYPKSREVLAAERALRYKSNDTGLILGSAALLFLAALWRPPLSLLAILPMAMLLVQLSRLTRAWGQMHGTLEQYYSHLRPILARCFREELRLFERQRLDYLIFYDLPAWKTLRKKILLRDGKTCRICDRKNINSNDITVDHIKPRSKYPELALDESNLQVLCRRCNSSKGASEVKLLCKTCYSTNSNGSNYCGFCGTSLE